MVRKILDQVIERCNKPQLIEQTIVNDMLHTIGTETESTTTKHASDKVSEQTVWEIRKLFNSINTYDS